jgi:hypothetical protein
VFDVERRVSFRGRIEVGWLFGLVRFRIRSKSRKPKRPREKPKERKSKSRMLRRSLKVIRRPSFRRRVWRLLVALVRSLHVRGTRLHVWVGLDDPADTGMLCAWVVPGLAILRQHTGADLLLYPDFEDERFEASAHGEIRAIPLAMIADFVLFALSPATLRAGWTMVAPSRT